MEARNRIGGRSCAALTFVAAILAPSVGRSATTFTQSDQFGGRHTISVAWADFNNDGLVDLAVGNNSGGNELYVNNGDGTFTQQNQFGPASLTVFPVVAGDFDNDGDQDVAVGVSGPNRLFVNNGDGTFSNSFQFGSGTTIAMAWGDFDADGDLDLAVGNGILGANQQNKLYVNDGNGFTERDEFGLLQSQAVAWADVDNDGDLDLAVANGGFGSVQQNRLYVNDGEGSFTERPEFGTGDTASIAWCDIDNDGDLDLAVGNWNNGQNRLFVNDGHGNFAGEPQFGARDTNTIVCGDFDHDGFVDVAVGNGDFTTADTNYVYYNNGDGTFTEAPEFDTGSTDGLAWADVDNDGDLDMAVGNEHTTGQNYLSSNNLNDSSYLHLKLRGHKHDLGLGYSNRDGVGARVWVYEAGFLGDPAHLLGFRQIEAHGGFASQNELVAAFGLPGQSTVDVRIVWPGSDGYGAVQNIAGVTVGQKLTVDEMPDTPFIPALSTWGLAAMGLSLMSAASLVLLRQRGSAPRRASAG